MKYQSIIKINHKIWLKYVSGDWITDKGGKFVNIYFVFQQIQFLRGKITSRVYMRDIKLYTL